MLHSNVSKCMILMRHLCCWKDPESKAHKESSLKQYKSGKKSFFSILFHTPITIKFNNIIIQITNYILNTKKHQKISWRLPQFFFLGFFQSYNREDPSSLNFLCHQKINQLFGFYKVTNICYKCYKPTFKCTHLNIEYKCLNVKN